VVQERFRSSGGSGEVAERFGSGSGEFGSAAESRVAGRAESQASVGEAQETTEVRRWRGSGEVWGRGSGVK